LQRIFAGNLAQQVAIANAKKENKLEPVFFYHTELVSASQNVCPIFILGN
jgi:hypothetical protein